MRWVVILGRETRSIHRTRLIQQRVLPSSDLIWIARLDANPYTCERTDERVAKIMKMTVNRRSFLKTMGAVVGLGLAPFGQFIRPAVALAAAKIRPFRFIHDESVAVVLDYARSDRRYDLMVRQDGEEVEFYANADPTRFDRLNSSYFVVEYA